MIEFLSLSKDAFGMEITDGFVRVMKLCRRGGVMSVASVGCVKIAQGVMHEGEIRDEEKLAETVKEAVLNVMGNKIKTRYVVVSLPENKAFLQVISMPKLRGEEMHSAVIFEAENYIPLPLEKVYLDYEVVPYLVPEGNKCEVLIAALPKEIIDSRIRVLEKAGLIPIVLELESQAVTRAVSAGRRIESPTIIIQIGDFKSNLIVYSDISIRFTFSIPISNKYFLEAIANGMGVTIDEAKYFKTEYGIEEIIDPAGSRSVAANKKKDFAAKGKVFEALIPGLVDFMQQVQKCTRYYQTHEIKSARDRVAKVLLCGSGSDLKGLDRFIALKLGTEVELASPFIDTSIIKHENKNGCDLRSFATASGLAMRALNGDGAVKSKSGKKKTALPVYGNDKKVKVRVQLHK